ncbi:MAG: 4-alpha-glucanotransferase, partial [Bauldia sp.]
MTETERVARLAKLAGIEPSYHDVGGNEVVTTIEAQRAVLRALSLDTETSSALEESLRRLDDRATGLIDQLLVGDSGRPIFVPLREPASPTVHWRLTNEAGVVTEGRAEVVDADGSPGALLPLLPDGYFNLEIRSAHRFASATIIIAPRKCWRPAAGRHWGVAAQIYALSSEADLGIGDFTDVARLAQAAGRRGADFVGLSPLHALFPADRSRISPYSPSSRLFYDAVYVDPATVPGFGERAAALHAESEAAVSRLKTGLLVDFAGAWAVKRPMLAALFSDFRARGGDPDFEAFRERRGAALLAHATFDALQEVFAERGIPLQLWPAAYRDRSSPEVRGFANVEAERIAFHSWLQWVADAQLGAAAAQAKSAGMDIGLYCDLAVAPDRGGSEVWSAPGQFGLGLSVGAPPDALAPQGQDWGLPPLHPLALYDNGLAPFRAAVQAVMRHSGAIRIDHAFQLRRLFLIPSGQPSSLGAYVSYPLEAMLAVLRLESNRARCIVIGEDLGIAPAGFADTLAESDILSYRVLYFEKGHHAFKAPHDYPTTALAVINTHDLATFPGWWAGQDIEDRLKHGIVDAEGTKQGRRERVEERKHLVELLEREKLLSGTIIPDDPPLEAVERLVARTRSDLVAVQIDDIAGATVAHNIPGVVNGAPNWRRRTPLGVEALAQPDGPLDLLARAMATEGRGRLLGTPSLVKPMKPASPKKPAVARTRAKPKATTDSATAPTGAGRVVIESVTPEIDGGLTAAKRVAGDVVDVAADIFTDGHDKIAADILFRRRDESEWRRAPMAPTENDRWVGRFPVEDNARYVYTIEAWRDPFASWKAEVEKKRAAGQDVRLEIQEGVHLADDADSGARPAELAALRSALAEAADDEERWRLLTSAESVALLTETGKRLNVSRYARELDLIVDRPAARFSAWYELFPRSASQDATRHGTFDDVLRLLPYVRDLGFDVLYFPPVHPIGVTNRKGKNNSLRAEPGDVGSVYAIGNADGGHDAVHPELGTIADFDRLVAAAADHGLEIALDFAINCSLDHPWIKAHPEWFEWRPDGTLKFAENPPKKYEDITNVHFYGEALPSLWYALRDVVLFWVDHGVKVFRVDNPHTKPLPFWEWMIGEVNRDHPDVIFLAEAFTRPKMMKKLAKVGFQQSYTYFTWRDTKADLTDYIKELAGPMGEYYRPNFFANTPDINPFYLQTSGRPGFVVRATLAATLSSTWGIYNGFELCEAAPLPGREEYLDSEKYELRVWDYDRPGNIRSHIEALNRIRRANPALHDFRNVTFLNAWNDNVIAYFRRLPDAREGVLVVVNLDPHHVHSTWFVIPLWDFGLADQASGHAEDLLLGIGFDLYGKNHQITRDPN